MNSYYITAIWKIHGWIAMNYNNRNNSTWSRFQLQRVLMRQLNWTQSNMAVENEFVEMIIQLISCVKHVSESLLIEASNVVHVSFLRASKQSPVWYTVLNQIIGFFFPHNISNDTLTYCGYRQMANRQKKNVRPML